MKRWSVFAVVLAATTVIFLWSSLRSTEAQTNSWSWSTCVPTDAHTVAMLSITAEQLNDSGIWLAMADERAAQMIAELDALSNSRFGFDLSGLTEGVVWFGESGMAACVNGAGGGEIRGDTEIQGHSALALDHDSVLTIADGILIVGNRGAVESTLAVLAGHAPRIAPEGPVANLVAELVGASELPMFLVTTAPELGAQLPPLAGYRGLGIGESGGAIRAVVRFPDERAAQAALMQVTSLRDMALLSASAEFGADADAPFAEAASAIVTRHMSEALLLDQLSLITAENDLVVLLDGGDSMINMATIGILASVAIPAFLRYIKRSKTTEATMNVRRLFESAVTYYDTEHATAAGEILPPQFPASATLSPATVPCGDQVVTDPAVWEQPTWEALNFRLSDPHYYSYQFDSSGVGGDSTFTASAFGDLDCDGSQSTFVRIGSISNGELQGGAGFYQMNELE